MESHRLKVKLGPHEFEAEGPPDVVQAQFEAWKDLIQSIPTPAQASHHEVKSHESAPAAQAAILNVDSEAISALFGVNEKQGVVFIKAHPVGENRNADAALLVLYGLRRLLGKEDALAGDIKDCLEESGIRVDRIDRTVGSHTSSGLLMKSGFGKGGRYRLSNTGLRKAEELVLQLRSQMA